MEKVNRNVLETKADKRLADKLDEFAEWSNGTEIQLTELYEQQEALLAKHKMGFWKEKKKRE